MFKRLNIKFLGGVPVSKTIQEINEKIKKGKAVVFTAEQAVQMAQSKALRHAQKKSML